MAFDPRKLKKGSREVTDDAKERIVAPTGSEKDPYDSKEAPNNAKILDGIDEAWEKRQEERKAKEKTGGSGIKGPPISGGVNSGKEEGWFN